MHEHLVYELLAVSLPALASIFCFAWMKSDKFALFLLFIGALVIRLYLISLDPYLQDWDERFHALVAKNMIEHPFKPMLRINPIMPYDYTAWCCNHIWV
ncbi:MAG TPA: hypothetical protein VI603_15435, partial [Saprospiraceae bacterium]|nr:hypothetical protein [Saprospiraceae bacterium]